jgi:hypothetical protein
MTPPWKAPSPTLSNSCLASFLIYVLYAFSLFSFFLLFQWIDFYRRESEKVYLMASGIHATWKWKSLEMKRVYKQATFHLLIYIYIYIYIHFFLVQENRHSHFPLELFFYNLCKKFTNNVILCNSPKFYAKILKCHNIVSQWFKKNSRYFFNVFFFANSPSL